MNVLSRKILRLLLGISISVATATSDVAAAQGPSGDAVDARIAGKPWSISYLSEAAAGINTLQSWYVPATGLYQAVGWWNSANAITVLANFSKVSGSKAYLPILQNTFVQAQKQYYGFLNHYYDDEGWWALAWIDAYDVSGDQQYLSVAQSIFEDMALGWDVTTCGGGIWWNKDRKYKNAIANELFLSVAARLANHMTRPLQKAHYLNWAEMEWQWFNRSGMINQDHLINDGLNSSDPSHCINNGKPVWSYNQGVVLTGLVELRRTGYADPALLPTAKEIADAALLHLTDVNGVLHDQGETKGGPGGGGVQFKGIFARNLLNLHLTNPQFKYQNFFSANANSIWSNAQGSNYQFGQVWSGPFSGASASSQSSALDALIAAAQAVAH